METEIKTEQITRIEVIGDSGRECVKYGSFHFSIQDDGRTLKIFVVEEEPPEKLKFQLTKK